MSTTTDPAMTPEQRIAEATTGTEKYNAKIAAAKEVFDGHNANVEEDLQVDWENFLKKLRGAGGTTNDTLNIVRDEQLEKWGVPELFVRRIRFLFRDKKEDAPTATSGTGSSYVSPKKAREMSHRDLVERYNPRDRDSGVFKRLAELSEGKAFIVLNSDGSADVDASIKLLQEIKDGHEPRDMYVVAGQEPRKVYKVGDRADAFDDKNPLYENRRLRPDGTCDQTQRSWDGVPLELRQIVYLALRLTGEISIDGVDDAHSVLDRVINQSATVKERYPKAVLKLREMAAAGSAPSLKVKRGGEGPGHGWVGDIPVPPNDPFKRTY